MNNLFSKIIILAIFLTIIKSQFACGTINAVKFDTLRLAPANVFNDATPYFENASIYTLQNGVFPYKLSTNEFKMVNDGVDRTYILDSLQNQYCLNSITEYNDKGENSGVQITFKKNSEIQSVLTKVGKNTDFAELEYLIFNGSPTYQFYLQNYNTDGSINSEGWAVSANLLAEDVYYFMVGPYMQYKYEVKNSNIIQFFFFCIDEIIEEVNRTEIKHHEIEINQSTAEPIITNLRNTAR